MIPGILLTLPIRTSNPNNGATGNSKLAAVIRSRRRAHDRGIARLAVAAALNGRRMTGPALAPWRVRITRISVSWVDWVNLGAFLKGVIDGIADALDIDDGDEARVRFVLDQRKGKRGEHAVEIMLQPMGGAEAVEERTETR